MAASVVVEAVWHYHYLGARRGLAETEAPCVQPCVFRIPAHPLPGSPGVQVVSTMPWYGGPVKIVF